MTARKPATIPPASKRLRNVYTKMCAANDDMGIFSTSQGNRVQNLLTASTQQDTSRSFRSHAHRSRPARQNRGPHRPFGSDFSGAYRDAAGGDAVVPNAVPPEETVSRPPPPDVSLPTRDAEIDVPPERDRLPPSLTVAPRRRQRSEQVLPWRSRRSMALNAE